MLPTRKVSGLHADRRVWLHDIFEIKKPSTNLLKHDESRDNYFWDTETAKAIVQVEKYIQMLIKKDKDVKDIIKEKHGLDVKVVRPKGHIIVGQSSQLSSSKMEDDFRLLSGSLKNFRYRNVRRATEQPEEYHCQIALNKEGRMDA